MRAIAPGLVNVGSKADKKLVKRDRSKSDANLVVQVARQKHWQASEPRQLWRSVRSLVGCVGFVAIGFTAVEAIATPLEQQNEIEEGRAEPDVLRLQTGVRDDANLNLSELDAPVITIRQAKLRGAVLDRANLRRASLLEADLQGAFLRGAQLQDARLEKADLRGAYLDRANLQGAFLNKANLEDIHIRDANVRGAQARGANLRGAKLDRSDLRHIWLLNADLSGASLKGTFLQGARVESAQLQNAVLVDANLQGAFLMGADLRGADLRGANLQSANLTRATLQRAKLEGAVYSQSTRFPQWPSCASQPRHCSPEALGMVLGEGLPTLR